MALSFAQPKFEGIYEVPNAAKYLNASTGNEAYHVDSRKLIRWIRQGLALPSLAVVHGRALLITFEDLISMRVIATLRAAGISFPKIYAAEGWLREHTGHERPFATETIWTERSEVFADFRERLVVASRHGQLAMTILTKYLIPVHGLRFDANGVANQWEPFPDILLDPTVQFGAPCIEGTRIPSSDLVGMVEAGDPVSFLANSYGLDEGVIEHALAWERLVNATANPVLHPRPRPKP